MELKHFTGADVIAGDAFVLAYDVKNGNFGVVSKTDLVTALGSLAPVAPGTGTWTTEEYIKAVELAKGEAVFWAKGAGNYALGIVATDNDLYIVMQGNDDNSGAPTVLARINTLNGVLQLPYGVAGDGTQALAPNGIRVSNDISIGAGSIQAENSLNIGTVGDLSPVTIPTLAYDNSDSDIVATTVKGALDELALRTPA